MALNIVPTRQTPQQQVDAWNIELRASPVYQQFMRSIGNDGSGRVRLSRDQQAQLEQALRQNGVAIPDGMHIDQGGNLNQQNRLARNIGIGAAVGGAALTGFGLAGMGPLAGLGGAGGAAGAGAAGVEAAGSFAAPTAASVASGGGGFFSTVGGFLSSPGGQIATSVGGKLVSDVIQSRANNRAVDAQAQAAQRALDWEKEVYNTDRRDYEPYRALGEQSTVRLGSLMSEPRPAPRTADQVFASGQLGGYPAPPRAVGSGQTPAAAGVSVGSMRVNAAGREPGADQMVLMEGPDGERRLVASASVPKYEARGARRIA